VGLPNRQSAMGQRFTDDAELTPEVQMFLKSTESYSDWQRSLLTPPGRKPNVLL
jgi:hypothetical protein